MTSPPSRRTESALACSTFAATEIEVLAGVVRTAASPGLRDPAAEHVERARHRREDPEQARVDIVGCGRADPQAHQVDDEDEELARQEERLRLRCIGQL